MSIDRVFVPLACLVGAVVAACDKPAPPPPEDPPATAESTAATTVPTWSGRWVDEFGAMIVVPSDSENAAVVVFPDSPTGQLIASSPLTLLNAAGDTIARRVVAREVDSLQCGDASLVRFSAAASPGWSVGVQAAALPALRLDSIEALPAADSARLVATLARIASALAGPADSRFNGLPFSVVSAHRFEITSRLIVAAHLMRRLPQEASPLEEHTLLIIERSRAVDSTYAVAFSQRSEGTEETAEHFEVLAVLRAKAATWILLARDQVSRTDYQILERSGTGTWRVRWSRPLAC